MPWCAACLTGEEGFIDLWLWCVIKSDGYITPPSGVSQTSALAPTRWEPPSSSSSWSQELSPPPSSLTEVQKSDYWILRMIFSKFPSMIIRWCHFPLFLPSTADCVSELGWGEWSEWRNYHQRRRTQACTGLVDSERGDGAGEPNLERSLPFIKHSLSAMIPLIQENSDITPVSPRSNMEL